MVDTRDRLLHLMEPNDTTGTRASTLDAKTDRLIRVGALVALGASPESYRGAIRNALDAGATVDEVVDAFIAVSSTVGIARMVTASPALACALGYDIDAALENYMDATHED
jgi:alkylhydroperoxidase/carboxymuconolactone decarboxylase family protein YurZ